MWFLTKRGTDFIRPGLSLTIQCRIKINVHKNNNQDKISINSYNAEDVTRSIHCQI